MTRIGRQIRLLIAESLLHLAWRIFPVGEEKIAFAAWLVEYGKKMERPLEIYSREQISDVVFEIMRRDGPDGHVDGMDVIVDFIMALLENRAGAWVELYEKNELEPPEEV